MIFLPAGLSTHYPAWAWEDLRPGVGPHCDCHGLELLIPSIPPHKASNISSHDCVAIKINRSLCINTFSFNPEIYFFLLISENESISMSL